MFCIRARLQPCRTSTAMRALAPEVYPLSCFSLFEPGQDSFLQRNAMIAEKMIGFYCDVLGPSISIPFECLQQRFAVWPGAIVCRNQ